jgi:hypothetical protein
MEDISNVFSLSNHKCLKHDVFQCSTNCADKQEINRALCGEVHVVMDGDGMDLELDDLQHAWMVEDTHEGAARALKDAPITPLLWLKSLLL